MKWCISAIFDLECEGIKTDPLKRFLHTFEQIPCSEKYGSTLPPLFPTKLKVKSSCKICPLLNIVVISVVSGIISGSDWECQQITHKVGGHVKQQ